MISSAIYLCSEKSIFFSNFLKETLKLNENCFFKCFYVLGIWDNYWHFKVCISWLLLASLCIIIASFTSKNTVGLARDSWQVRGSLSDVDCCGIMEPAIKIQQLSIVNWHQLMCFFFGNLLQINFLISVSFSATFWETCFCFAIPKKIAIEKFDVENDDNIDELIFSHKQTKKQT